jgi:hypothetical protein
MVDPTAHDQTAALTAGERNLMAHKKHTPQDFDGQDDAGQLDDEINPKQAGTLDDDDNDLIAKIDEQDSTGRDATKPAEEDPDAAVDDDYEDGKNHG